MQQKEADFLAKALMKSEEEFENRQSANTCATLKDVQEKFKAKQPWIPSKKKTVFMLLRKAMKMMLVQTFKIQYPLTMT